MKEKRPKPLVSIEAEDRAAYSVQTHADGPPGKLPLDPEFLRYAPSGDIFGLSQDAGMGWNPGELKNDSYLILGTAGGIRAPDGKPIALGFHTGHWEIDLLMQSAAKAFTGVGAIPHAAFVSDPCDGRTQGTPGMMDSLAYRNDADFVLRRLIRSLPTRVGVMGIATCDKGLPAMLMALASQRDTPCIAVPGGVTLPPTEGEDTGKIQTIGARYANGEISLEEAAEWGCRTCASPGGGCHFLGTAATTQVVSEALGLSLVHSALAPSGQPIWADIARRSAKALVGLKAGGIGVSRILTEKSLHNAMVVYAAFGGSTNLILHLPAIAYSAGIRIPEIEDWQRINSLVPRLVDVLPNGPVGHPTIRVYLAGGVPEVMLHLRNSGLLHLDASTVQGLPLGDSLEIWEKSDRRRLLRGLLLEEDGIAPDEVIMDPEAAKQRGLTSTVTFPIGNIAPAGSVIKSTAIDPAVVDDDGVYRKTGPARIFVTEREAIEAVKSQTVRPGEIMVLIGRGPLGSGMEETYQITSALRYLPWGKDIALITDARFSGVSTGACIGHAAPEALAGGPIGKVRDGDLIEIVIDTGNLTGSVNLIGDGKISFDSAKGAEILAGRSPHPDLAPDPSLPDETRLWAALQQASGGTWRGCVYDVDRIIELLNKGSK